MYKTRKLSKQNLLMIIMAMALIVSLTFSLTRAWFVTGFSDEGNLKFGNISVIDNNVEFFTSAEAVVPGDKIPLVEYDLDISHDIPLYVRMTIALTAVEYMVEGDAYYRPFVEGDLTTEGNAGVEASLLPVKMTVVADSAEPTASEVKVSTITTANWRGVGTRKDLPAVGDEVTLIPAIGEGQEYERVHELTTAGELNDSWFVGLNKADTIDAAIMHTNPAREGTPRENGSWVFDKRDTGNPEGTNSYYWVGGVKVPLEGEPTDETNIDGYKLRPVTKGTIETSILHVFASTAEFNIPSELTLEDASGKSVFFKISFTVVQADNAGSGTAQYGDGTLTDVKAAFSRVAP